MPYTPSKTFGKLRAAGGFCSKFGMVRLTNAAGSATMTGVTSSDRVEGAAAFKLSGALIKTTAEMSGYVSLGTDKVIWSNVRACSSGLLLVWWQDLTP